MLRIIFGFDATKIPILDLYNTTTFENANLKLRKYNFFLSTNKNKFLFDEFF